MPKLFFCSDLHLHHPNILKYEPGRIDALSRYLSDRDGQLPPNEIKNLILESMKNKHSDEFENFLTEHDNMLIENWNKKVRATDYVIYLGDFAYCQHACKGDTNFDKVPEDVKNKIIELGKRLNGHKLMIMGNHDWRGTFHQGPLKGIHYVYPEVKRFWEAVGFEVVYPDTQVFKKYFELSHEPSPYYSPSMVRFNIYGHVHSDVRFITQTENSLCVCADRHNLSPIEFKDFNNFESD